MMPIHELLSRIRRDEAFGQAEFEIGYYDRLLGACPRIAIVARARLVESDFSII
jgi:hypothetical protein